MEGEMTETHPAIRFLTVGRGYGVTRVPVVNFGALGSSTMLHVIHEDKPICGNKAQVTSVYEACDPKAVKVAGANVCYRCQIALGHVPMPSLIRESEEADG